MRTSQRGPFELRFRLVNHGSDPVMVHKGCAGVSLEISSCGSRFTDWLGPPFTVNCACDCSQPPSTCKIDIACGVCPANEGVVIAPGASLDVPWPAIWSVPQNRSGRYCVDARPLGPGVYSVSVPLYQDAAAAAGLQTPVRWASRAFDLPAPGGLVELELGPPVPGQPACEKAATDPLPRCTTPWSASKACGLGASYTITWPGSLAFAYDDARLTAAGTYTLTRRFVDDRPTLSCTNQLPRCGATHAVFTTADLAQALSAPDVVAALAQPTPVVHGYDARANDAGILALTRDDGRGLLIGSPCREGFPCEHPVTAGLQHLQAIVQKITQQQLAAPGCASLRQ